jgi:predicted HTH transcriptional regulator
MSGTKLQEHKPFNAREWHELKSLVASGEGKKLEFKRKASFPEKIVREMIAFANTEGGTVLIGVEDNGNIPGLKYPDGESHVIRKALNQCRPSLRFIEQLIPIGNARSVLRYDIPESKRKMHYLLHNGMKDSFVRVNDQSIRASREVREIVRRAQRKRDIRFHYGEHERLLMRYLDENPAITVGKFMELGKLSRFNASRKLILLVLADVLHITPHEKGDLFSRLTAH